LAPSHPTAAPTPSAPPTHEVRLQTERLILRAFAASDATVIAPLANDWEVVRFTAGMPHPYTEEAARDWIASRGEDDEITFAIVRRADGVFLGGFGVEPELEKRQAVVGYWLGKPYWGQGYASEALAAALDYAFASFDIDRVRASVVPENRASIRVMEKNGFRYDGIGLVPAPARGGPVAVEFRALTRAEWLKRKQPPPLPVVLVAAVALVDADGRVLIAKRPEGKTMAGLWEFPGGKVQDRETPESALIRELKEELSIDVKSACLAPLTFASHRYDDFHLLMPLYVCRRWEGVVTPLEGQEAKWVMPAKLADYPMPPADQPLVAMLRDFL
jgi:8-oxo-dGTP diphosphatase